MVFGLFEKKASFGVEHLEILPIVRRIRKDEEELWKIISADKASLSDRIRHIRHELIDIMAFLNILEKEKVLIKNSEEHNENHPLYPLIMDVANLIGKADMLLFNQINALEGIEDKSVDEIQNILNGESVNNVSELSETLNQIEERILNVQKEVKKKPSLLKGLAAASVIAVVIFFGLGGLDSASAQNLTTPNDQDYESSIKVMNAYLNMPTENVVDYLMQTPGTWAIQYEDGTFFCNDHNIKDYSKSTVFRDINSARMHMNVAKFNGQNPKIVDSSLGIKSSVATTTVKTVGGLTNPVKGWQKASLKVISDAGFNDFQSIKDMLVGYGVKAENVDYGFKANGSMFSFKAALKAMIQAESSDASGISSLVKKLNTFWVPK